MSHDRLKTFATDLGNSVINHWEKIGVVVPPPATKGVSLLVGLTTSTITLPQQDQKHLFMGHVSASSNTSHHVMSKQKHLLTC